MIYTSVDIGSHSIKIVVAEKINDKFYVLASTSVKSMGIKRGIIKDKDLVLNSLKEAFTNINNDLGVEIKKVLLSFPLFLVNTSIETSDISVNGIVSSDDVKEVIGKTVSENIDKKEEVLYLEPLVFEIDSDLQVVDPKGLTADRLKVRCAVSTIERKYLYDYFSLFQELDREVVDITYGVIGDNFENANIEMNKKLGVLVNLGYSKCEIAIFNKGIMLKGEVLPIGSKKIDKDISYIYKIDRKQAISLKEEFAVSSSKYADMNNFLEITNLNGEKIKINQVEISQVIEARLKEILKSVKSEINNLTNRSISYIIITGGITNLVGFPYLVEEEFKIDKVIANLTTIGVRSNMYSTSFGLIKYFAYKAKSRNIDYLMFDLKDKENLASKKKKVSTRDNLIGKIEAYLKS